MVIGWVAVDRMDVHGGIATQRLRRVLYDEIRPLARLHTSCSLPEEFENILITK
jgi:hypothetical protein